MNTREFASAIAEISNPDIKERCTSLVNKINEAEEKLDSFKGKRSAKSGNIQVQQHLVLFEIPAISEGICQLLRLIANSSLEKIERNFSWDQARKAYSLMYLVGCSKILDKGRELEIFLQVKEVILCYENKYPIKHRGISCVYSIVGLTTTALKDNFTSSEKLGKNAKNVIDRAILLKQHRDLKVGIYLIELFTKLCSDYCCFLTATNFKADNDNKLDSGKIKISQKTNNLDSSKINTLQKANETIESSKKPKDFD
jgi:hypothetical protein